MGCGAVVPPVVLVVPLLQAPSTPSAAPWVVAAEVPVEGVAVEEPPTPLEAVDPAEPQPSDCTLPEPWVELVGVTAAVLPWEVVVAKPP